MWDDHSIDRLSVRNRPEGIPIMYQSWTKLLFMHWAVRPELLRPLVPSPLAIDTFDGSAWIGITPFFLRNLRPVFLPPLPWLSNFNEINLRTYVHFRGVPGIWFISLDADRYPAVVGARFGFHLPYRYACISARADADGVRYATLRLTPPKAEFHASWKPGDTIGEAKAGTLEFFLVERYCLYSMTRGRLYRGRIHHRPWLLQQAQLLEFNSTMMEAHGLPHPSNTPLVHHSDAQHVAIWPLERA